MHTYFLSLLSAARPEIRAASQSASEPSQEFIAKSSLVSMRKSSTKYSQVISVVMSGVSNLLKVRERGPGRGHTVNGAS